MAKRAVQDIGEQRRKVGRKEFVAAGSEFGLGPPAVLDEARLLVGGVLGPQGGCGAGDAGEVDALASVVLAAPVVEAGLGVTSLEMTRAQEVRASTSSGDVDLTVPPGRYRVDTGDDEGADIEVVDDPDARYALELDTSSGDIAVRTR